MHVHENEKVTESEYNIQKTLPEKKGGNSNISVPLYPVCQMKIHKKQLNDVHSGLVLSQNIQVNNKICTADTVALSPWSKA